MASPLGLRASVGAPEGRRGPLTVTQHELWALARREPPPAVLNLSYAVAVEGPLDRAALEDAFRDLVRRHEPLRTTYAEPVAEVGDEELGSSGIDLMPRPVQDLDEAAVLARRERDRGFDLTREAPLRAGLLGLPDGRHVLLLTLHHVAADGWSLRLLSTELSRRYAARLRGEPPPAAEERPECVEHARWQRDWLRSEAAERELEWWTDRLRSASTELPVPGARPRETTCELSRRVVVLPDELTAALRRLGREANASLYVLLLTACQALVARWSGCAEPVVGTLVASRPTAASAQVLGAHYNVLLLATDLAGDPALAECLLRASQSTVRALDRQTLPYPVLAERLERKLGGGAARTPSVMLLLDRYPLEDLRLEGCRTAGLYLGGGSAAQIDAATAADLTFFVREAGDRLTLSALAPGGVEEGWVTGMMRSYVEVLTAMVESPELPLSEPRLPLDAPGAGAADDASPQPGLHEVADVAPVEALSPVGRFALTPYDDP